MGLHEVKYNPTEKQLSCPYFYKKVAPAGNRTRVVRSEVGALIRCAIEAWLKNLLFFVYIKLKFSFQHTSDAAQVHRNPESMGDTFFLLILIKMVKLNIQHYTGAA